MATRKQLDAAIEAAKREYDAAEDALTAVYAKFAPDSPEEEQATAACREKFAILDAAHKALGRAYPAPLGRIGDRGCGKSRR